MVIINTIPVNTEGFYLSNALDYFILGIFAFEEIDVVIAL